MNQFPAERAAEGAAEGAADLPAGTALSCQAAKVADQRAIHAWGIPSVVLMENAGRACADEAQVMLQAMNQAPASIGEVLVLCGPGNNGGDGLVVARTLVNRGYRASVVVVGGIARLERAGKDVQHNLRLWRAFGGQLEEVVEGDDSSALERCLARCALVVDALFGIGLTRPLKGSFAACVRSVGDSKKPVLAVDLPSGLHADTGEVLGVAMRAAATVTFVAPKLGLQRGAGPEHAGRVLVAEIGIPLKDPDA